MLLSLAGLAYLFRYPSWLACLCITLVLRVFSISLDLTRFALGGSTVGDIWRRFLDILPANLIWAAGFFVVGSIIVLVRKWLLRREEMRDQEEHREAMAKLNRA